MNAQGEALMCARVCPIAEGKKRTRGAVLGVDSDYLCTVHPDDYLAKLIMNFSLVLAQEVPVIYQRQSNQSP